VKDHQGVERGWGSFRTRCYGSLRFVGFSFDTRGRLMSLAETKQIELSLRKLFFLTLQRPESIWSSICLELRYLTIN